MSNPLSPLPPPTWTPPPTVVPPDVTQGPPLPGLPTLDVPPPPPSLPTVPEIWPPPAGARGPEAPTLAPQAPCADCDTGNNNYPAGDRSFTRSRLRPENEIGPGGTGSGGGVTLGSRNYNWQLGLLNMPGRAGLDVNLALFYNSLVWVRQGEYIKFNPDRGFPGPGFRLGLPQIESATSSGGYGGDYLLQRPDGGRVELRRNETTLYNDATDGSHIKALMQGGDSTGYGATSATVWWPDGTKMTFAAKNGKLYPTVITDRNGNQITAVYDNLGHLTEINDTAGRAFYFNYDSNKNLISITQQRTPGPNYVWAEFAYTALTLTPDFGALRVNLPTNPTISVLQRVKLPDGTVYTFDYNAYGQVKRFNRYATDSSSGNEYLMSYVAYDLSDTGTLNDCPRFTAQRVWGRSANGDREGTPASDGSEDTITTFAVDPSAANGTQPAWSSFSTPDGTYYKELYNTSETWRRGLAVRSEIRVGNLLKKWITTDWTQDDLNAAYANNPRPAIITIYDGELGSDGTERRRRTELSYTDDAYRLPKEVKEYDNTLTTLIRRTRTDYQLDTAYTSRNIIGLVAQRRVWDGADNLLSKTTYSYDWEYEHLVGTPVGVTVPQRTAGYGADYRIRRGNLCQVARWDVTDPNNTAKMIESKLGYDITGNVRFSRDALWRQTFFDYSDRTAEGYTNSNQQSYLYATRITDPLQSGKPAGEQKHAYAGYDYYTGQIRKTEGLPAAGQSVGAVQTYNYDTVGRLSEVLTALGTEAAYGRVAYTYSPVQGLVDVQRRTGELDYVLARQIANGLGQVYLTGATHPSSTGGYRAQQMVYDKMGRVVKRSNPTETNYKLYPAGADVAGWVWTEQAYDWQGRPTVTTNPDGTQRTSEYGGCGCAGNLSVTNRDESGRRRRYAQDTLGRLAKTEELNWDGSAYSTTTYTYNALDQLTQLRQNAGATTTDANARVRTFAYDGYGRLKERTTPEQGLVKFAYNADDTINTLTDARNAVTTYQYDPRGLVERLTYNAPAGIAATPLTTFEYDTAGNRTGMVTNGVGTTSFTYDQLSRPLSEKRVLDGVGTYTLNYQWGRSGTLASMTNATLGTTVNYAYTAADELVNVNGSGAVSAANYLSNIKYRAFGAPSQITYGNTRQLAMGYNNRLFLTSWNLPNVGGGTNTAQTALGYDYSYTLPNYTENTGRVAFARSRYDTTLDRTWLYDHTGRLSYAYTDADARSLNGGGPAQQWNGHYAQEYKYDVYGNMTQRVGWGGEHAQYSASFTSKNQNLGFQYDQSGNLVNDGGQNYAYDAQGQQTFASIGNLTQTYDGDGLRVKKVEGGAPTWYLRSAVLGNQVIAEIGLNNVWQKGYIYAGSQLLAIQDVAQNRVLWVHQEPYTKGQRLTDSNGNIISGIELDPYGGETSKSFDPGSVNAGKRYTSYTRDGNRGDEAHFRRYERWHSRFYQPDPYDGSLSLGDPQSFNRYSYTNNDPVNFVDPTGLLMFHGQTCYLVVSGTNWTWDGGNYTQIHSSAVVCFSTGGGGGNGGGAGIGNGGGGNGDKPQTSPDAKDKEKKKKNKCRQDKDGNVNRPIIEDNLRRSGYDGQITGPIEVVGEGLAFDIVNQAQIRAGLDNDSRFTGPNAVLDENHRLTVGPGGQEFRSYTTPDGLGGVGSLQIVVGASGSGRNGSENGARVYADFDCTNPRQDVASFIQHNAPRIGRRIGGFLGRIF